MPLITNLQNPLTKDKDNKHPSRQGAQSPPAETQSSKQMGEMSSGQTTSSMDPKQKNEEFLKNLDSNPAVAPMDPTAYAKTGKPGAPLDGL
ncbi:hypothetical protein TWF694_008787 [Orbilia ellipsospora]|uniref:Uncharacterized protein n=1 Tax=Orbilia ellipsospora TaxID=2528407 RepID=A0AAV9XDI0_9PEZI